MTRNLWLLILLLPLAGCQMGAKIKVVGSPEAPSIIVTKSGFFPSNAPARIDHVSVMISDGAPGYHPAWVITGACTQIGRVDYGRAPAGFRELSAPQTLRPDTVYEVHAAGCGYWGGALFMIRRGHIVFVDGTSDELRAKLQAMS
jgi:hypothetical protein